MLRIASHPLALLLGLLLVCVAPAFAAQNRIPVIYSSDLFHPHDDPDDHFDAATLLAMPELDVRLLILDQGARQARQPGSPALEQLGRITHRKIPFVRGLPQPLKNPSDAATDQPTQGQRAVEGILTVLRKSKDAVCICTVGSVRDVMAAFNRDPSLFHRKVRMFLAFIGEASDPQFLEWNVQLDPHAYVAMMRSGLPVYWVPCFDGGLWQNRGHASFWRVSHRDLLRNASPSLLQYFIYALEKRREEPIAFLKQPVDPQSLERLLQGERNLWCTSIFGVMSGRQIQFNGGRYRSLFARPGGSLDPSYQNALFAFEEVAVAVDDAGHTLPDPGPNAKTLYRFAVRDRNAYAQGMTEATQSLLSSVGKRW
jgi:hypothetical protein